MMKMEKFDQSEYKNILACTEHYFEIELSLIEKVALKYYLIETTQEPRPKDQLGGYNPGSEAIVRFMMRYYQLPAKVAKSFLYPTLSINSCLSGEARENIKNWLQVEQMRQHKL